MHFGEHLTIDGYGGEESRLNDPATVRLALNQLPAKIEMNPLSEPQVVFAPGNGQKDPGGWSGYVIIEEGHISIHTFPKRGFVNIDVYSCKNSLKRNLINEYFVDLFKLSDTEVNFLKRGTRYPSSDLS